ncbi:DNA oxidative demethylase AlkB [Limnobaculum zhutongyuii]|uniref:DNA oxidative demethylase AlkB n=1 Tax=Limnobaculum zhutongyuii TaxID=2498113 RepID=A0A411WL61_9GAMM|nr:DNA oxidative demethylase AlkB [Limnobaculum zhutongyuii]QBH96896.1 DNA oxidative demethylase AlkB [Limnobaculum zhutongyuii]TQS87000.1 DNA oxidative demethylase AlkB [Limnobaculum zhutongyuii]
MTFDLFEHLEPPDVVREEFAPGAVILRHFVLPQAKAILAEVAIVVEYSPFRHMTTPGGYAMSVAMTNCGDYGWVTDHQGYRYSAEDPLTGKSWPPIAPLLYQLAVEAAVQGGFPDFQPNVCLINRYAIGAKMSLHQDKDEKNFDYPIVSMSFGLPAIFQFGGFSRSDSVQRCLLTQGDVVVWGGSSRLAYHGILPVKAGYHSDTGDCRINLTFRKVN